LKTSSLTTKFHTLLKLELPIITIAVFATNFLSLIQATRHHDVYHFDITDSPTIAGLIAGLTIAVLSRILSRKNSSEKSYHLHLVESLAIALDERDRYTFGHTRRVTNLSLQLADQLSEQSIDRELLRLSCLLHDIGKIGIPDAILLKPGKLTKEEFEQIQKHPDRGARILHPACCDSRIKEIAGIIRHHHERFDGKGYPDALQGEEIPLLARIITLADSFDAMTSDRPYRKGMAYETALKIITENSGSQFDPILAPKFVALLRDCQLNGLCEYRHHCHIFPQISNHRISIAYELQYCQSNYKACARFQSKNKTTIPSNLLPDGSLLLG